MEIFWKTIGLYNSATWICQIGIILIGIILTVLLLKRPRRWNVISMKIYLIALYLWIAIAYYSIYCAERNYNNVMAIFWGVLAASWLWDLIAGYTTFESNHKHTKLACVLLALPFLYPIISLLRGMSFPEMTSPVMPCSVVVFTIGLMLMFSRKVNLFIVLMLCHWSVIGISKTFYFNIPEDYLLTCASVPAVYIFLKDYFLSDLHDVTKPQAKYLNWFLIALCIIVCLLLLGSMFVTFAKVI